MNHLHLSGGMLISTRSMVVSRPPQTPCFVEALEPRIAPAGLELIVGAPTNEQNAPTGAATYSSTGTPFQQAATNPEFAGLGFGADHYFLDLRSGDTVDVVAKNSVTSDFIKLSKGSAFAFFFDRDRDGIPTVSELTGLSVSGGVAMSVKGNIDGDVVANRDAKTGAFDSDGLISAKQTIAQFTAGDVGRNAGDNGLIIAGGNISKLSVGNTSVIQSGTPTGPVAYSFGGTGSIGGSGVIQVFDAGRQGGNLTAITVDSADSILAGPGGSGGGKGGKVTGVVVIADADGIEIRGGAGGGGLRGGEGGAVSKVVFQGTSDSLDVGKNLVKVYGGQGGAGDLGGTGGKGGAVSEIWVGYNQEVGKNKKVTFIESSAPVQNNIEIVGGQGGSGSSAGVGGKLSKINVFAAPTEDGTTEILLAGGDGGLLLGAAKKAGAGGNVEFFKVKNIDTSADPSDTRVEGGDASVLGAGATAAATGANGGKVVNPEVKPPRPGQVSKFAGDWLVGASFELAGGDGSSALSRGGAGGDVVGLSFQAFGGLVPRALDVAAGAGGAALTGGGGKGGMIDRFFVPVSDLEYLRLAAGDGGRGSKGGAGGNLSKVEIFDFDPDQNPMAFTANISSGRGGAGTQAGGNGGNVSGFNLFSTIAALNLRAGDGGSADGIVVGKGGKGGSVNSFALLTEKGLITDTVAVVAGRGGDGKAGGAAGAGGSITLANLQAQGSISVIAGAGGASEGKGKTGDGGSVGALKAPAKAPVKAPAKLDGGLAATSFLGDVVIVAGSGGIAGNNAEAPAGGNGGSIVNAVAAAKSNITLTAGDGASAIKGGKGGSLANIGFYGSAGSSSAPAEDVILTAGRGGAAPAAKGTGGAGGNIFGASGLTSIDVVNLDNNPATWDELRVRAGDAGSGGSRGGAGGTIDRVSLFEGLAPFSLVAGSGGNGGQSAGAGGNIMNISSAVRSIALALAAGDGGNATMGSKGGLGGSVNKVDVLGDIGIRQGKNYGFAVDGSAMGGIFAGQGGSAVGGTVPVAGKVTNITAQGIAAIAAGRGPSPLLASLVDGIYLTGNQAATQLDGRLTNFDAVSSFYSGTGTPTGGPGGGVNVNVLGDGALLNVGGRYSGQLDFNLKTGGGEFDGVTVVYLDTRAGGIASTANLTVSLAIRNALNSSVIGRSLALPDYRSTLEFDTGFAPDYALAFGADFGAALYQFVGNSLVQVAAPSLTQNATDAWALSIRFDDLVLPSTVASEFKFVANYMAGDVILNQAPVQSVGAFRTNQSVGFGIGPENPGSAQVPPSVAYPVTRVTSHATFTQDLSNIVGGKAGDPLAIGAINFHYVGGSYQPSVSAPRLWNYGTDVPLDGLIATAKLGDKRNFMPLALLTDASGSSASLYLPTLSNPLP
jgi:hypothetical protein